VRDAELYPPLTGLAFLAGNVCHPDARPEQYRHKILSVDEINDAPGLTRRSIDYFAEKYGAPAADTKLSPLLFESHTGLARKAYFAICGWDPRRDESLLWEQLLKQSGTETSMHVYPGLPHGFWTTCPELPVSRKWQDEYIEGINWLLQ
jgi:acetyl esterase/lipase